MYIPPIGLGTFRLQGQQAYDSVAAGLALGYRHIDTAQIYGNEAEVGQALADSGVRRSDVFVTTKIWLENLEPSRLASSLKDSLRKLAVDNVDLTLIHWPPPGAASALRASMQALAEAKNAGLTRLIGVSNFTVAQLAEAVSTVGAGQIATNQVEIHPFLQNRKLADYARTHGIHLTAYMPLAYGKVMQDPTIRHIAEAHDATAAQVTLAWLLQQGYAVIPSSTKPANLAGNLKAAETRLTPAEMDALHALDRNERIADPEFAPDWD